jgi:hypothetical protein
MCLSLNRRTGIILATCIFMTGCGDPLVEPANVNESQPAIESSDIARPPVVSTGEEIDRRPRKILSPDERRRVEVLLQIYRDARTKGSQDDQDIAARALDEIDPRIMKDQRARDAADARQQTDKTVADMISEYEGRTTAP